MKAQSVLVLSLVFPPDGVSTAQLFGELVEDLVDQGRRVVVITTAPHYNPPPSWTAERLWGGLLRRSHFHGATVYHTAMPRKGRSILARVPAWMGFHVLSIVAAWSVAGETDVVLAPSPPLTIGVAAWVIAATKRVRYVYNVQELYPDAAVALGAISNGPLLRVLRAVERFVYDRAFAVVVIAPGMRDRIVARGVPPGKARIIPNFVDTADIAPRPKRNAFAVLHGLADRFVVLYAGNMGRAQQLDTVIDAAARLADRNDIVFAFVGEGVQSDALRAHAAALELRNVLFVPQQPYSMMPEIYGASDLCLVPLLGGLAFDAVPSKVYRIMAAERPVLAVTAVESDLARVVHEARAGVVVAPGDAAALSNAVLSMADAPMDVRHARAWVGENVERRRVTAQYGDILDEAAAG